MKRLNKFFLVFALVFVSLSFVNAGFFQKEEICGEGSLYNSCSSVKPYFCSVGILVENASFCGCPENFIAKDNSCISRYFTNPKIVNLTYILRGEENNISFVGYGGFEEYVTQIPRSIQYSNGNNFSRADFKINTINEEEQRKMIAPLVIKIQNITLDKEDQARIAISLVQNIPYEASDKTSNFGAYRINYSRYPYEVLYDNKGICGEKTDLLALLLDELGYGTGFFYYSLENHEAFGIKCSFVQSLKGSGYCFVETTSPSIITDDKIDYINIGKLNSEPEIYTISEGNSFGVFRYEYSDAKKLIRIRKSIEKDGLLSPLRNIIFENLKEKYGLSKEYYG